MKRAFLAAILTLLMGASLMAPTSSASDPFSRALASTVYVESSLPNGISKCSGFVVGGQHIITANHCLGDETEAIRFEEDDVAVMKADSLPAPLEFAEEAKLGQKGWVVGYPGGAKDWPLILSTSVAALESGYRPGTIRNIFHDGARYGMSGGPIINEDGKVIGMVSEMQEKGGAFILSSPTLQRLKEIVKQVVK